MLLTKHSVWLQAIKDKQLSLKSSSQKIEALTDILKYKLINQY